MLPAKSEGALSDSRDDGGSTESIEDYDEEFEEESLLESKDKFLIFTTGSKTFTPHQIGVLDLLCVPFSFDDSLLSTCLKGFKRIKPVQFRHRLDPGPSLKERLAEQRRRVELERQQMELGAPPRPPEPNWLDYDSVSERFDKVDHLIDLHGHIIGMGLSPDHRFLSIFAGYWLKIIEMSQH